MDFGVVLKCSRVGALATARTWLGDLRTSMPTEVEVAPRSRIDLEGFDTTGPGSCGNGTLIARAGVATKVVSGVPPHSGVLIDSDYKRAFTFTLRIGFPDCQEHLEADLDFTSAASDLHPQEGLNCPAHVSASP